LTRYRARRRRLLSCRFLSYSSPSLPTSCGLLARACNVGRPGLEIVAVPEIGL
jgi:hypothetical protein